MGGRSLLEWNLRWLLAAGVGPIWVNVHYRAAAVREAVQAMDLGDVEILFSPENPILGTAGGWRNLAAEWDGTSLVVCGDNLTRFDLGSFAAAHQAGVRAAVQEGSRRGRTLATVALFDPGRHAHTGIAGSRVLVDGGGRVVGFQEVRGAAAGASLVSTGACLLEPAVADGIDAGFADFGADVFPSMVRGGSLAAHVVEDGAFCLGLDTPVHFEVGRGLVEAGAVALG